MRSELLPLLKNNLSRLYNSYVPDKASNKKHIMRYQETDYQVVARLMFERNLNTIILDIEQELKK